MFFLFLLTIIVANPEELKKTLFSLYYMKEKVLTKTGNVYNLTN